MTLIILGHNYEQGFSWGDEEVKMEADGLFVASDSAITNGRAILLGGFQKVYPVPIKIWKPYFIEQSFHSYNEVFYDAKCFVAFSGSTLVAQHVLNCISEHLEKLRISFERPCPDGKGEYVIVRHCQKNRLHDNTVQWDETMFVPNSYKHLKVFESVLDTIEYSIKNALSSARKYKLNQEALDSMYTEFAVGMYCPRTKSHHLYTFKMDYRLGTDGIYEVFVTKKEIPPEQVVTLGVKGFELEVQKIFNDAMAKQVSPAKKVFNFLNQTIDESIENHCCVIDKPSSMKIFKRGKLTLKEVEQKE